MRCVHTARAESFGPEHPILHTILLQNFEPLKRTHEVAFFGVSAARVSEIGQVQSNEAVIRKPQ